MVTPPGFSAEQSPESALQLTTAEQAWLAAHQSVRVAFDGHFPPYSFIAADGELEGLAVDVLQLLSERTGLQFEISPKVIWKELYQAAQQREVDLVATMGDRPERAQWFSFTRPYIFKSLVIVTRDTETTIHGPQALAGKKVALVEDYQHVKTLLEQHPTVQPVFVETMLDGLNAVAIGEAEAAISMLGASHYLINRYQISGLKFAAVLDRDSFTESIAIRNDWPELASLLDKALATISTAELHQLQEKWLPAEDFASRIALTGEEHAWLQAHQVIRVGIDPEFTPFEFRDKDGRYVGIAADYLKLLQEQLGVRFVVEPNLSWSQVIEKARNREIDLLPCVGRTSERETYLRYSNSYINSQRMILTRRDAPFISGLTDLSDWRVAVQADSSNEGYLKEHSSILPIRVATVQEGLVALSGGKVDAFVNNIGSSSYWIRELSITNLKVAAPVSEGRLHVAVRKDWPLLAGIINKALATISEAERRQIAQRWISIDYKTGVEKRTIYLALAVILGSVLLLITGFSLWNRTLRRKVQQRTIELQQELSERKKAVEALAAAESRFREMLKNIRLIAVLLDNNGKVTFCNDFLLQLAGLTKDQLLGADWFDLVAPEAQPEVKELFLQGLKTGEIVAHYENPLRMPDQNIRQIVWNNTVLRDAVGRVVGTASIGMDVTEQKLAEQELAKHHEQLEELVKERTADLEEKTQALQQSRTAMQYLLEDINEANAKLKQVDQLKSLFIASMSHELRTPLNSVIGYSSILLNEWTGPLNDEQKQNVGSVLRSGKHLLSLINDVIDLSKVEAGMLEVSRDEFDLAELLSELEQSFSKQVLDKQLSLNVQRLQLPLLTDRRRLLQCLLNLVSNAIKFTEQGGVTVEIQPDAATGWVEFRVSDTGIGISAEDQPKLFQPFSRVPSALSSKVLGTGLGLYLTKKIISEVLHGTISLTSEAGRGSSFSIRIPGRLQEESEGSSSDVNEEGV